MAGGKKIESLYACVRLLVLCLLLLAPNLRHPPQLAAQAEETGAGAAGNGEPAGQSAEDAAGDNEAGAEPGPSDEDAAAVGAEPGESEELSRGFNNILLGMNMEDVKEELKEDPNFNFRGDPDVSMMRTPNTSLIETRGYYYVDRASFQFINDSLYTITIILDPNRIGHYAMFTTLTNTYGEPDTLSPEKSRWENDEVIISLERPLRVKYMAKKVLERLKREQRKKKSMETLTRERFLEQF